MTADVLAIERARQTAGVSSDAIYRAASAALRSRAARGVVVDVGCGAGRLRDFIGGVADEYLGVDVVRHRGLAGDVRFVAANLDSGPIPIESESADAVVSLETIEHLENPRGLFRELTRLLKPGGCLVVTTPNQASLLNWLTLAAHGEFAAFRGHAYPAHRTALLPIDLVRMAAECGLRDGRLHYTHRGRIPLTSVHYPHLLSRALPRALSDNVLLVARKDA